ncbi:MAG: inorganic diphosphatase [Flavobacteriales bacterium]|nr:inorganic diphosphatase [Flavobacteriales bacterium]
MERLRGVNTGIKVIALSFIVSISSCLNDFDYSKVPVYSKTGNVNCVIEIPAGTNHKIEYNYDSNSFSCDQRDGKDRIIQFMPYPANYGFIPSTIMDKDRGGDGDAIDVFVVASAIETGTVVECKVVGVCKLLDAGEQDDKLIAIPVDESLQIVKGNSVAQMDSAVFEIIKTWLLNYSSDKMIFQGWGEAEEAKDIIEKWRRG